MPRGEGDWPEARATSEAERDDIWQLRRELSPALKKISTIKLNNDVVVPRGRIPELFALVKEIEQESGLPIASFGHAGDGNIHVNIMIPDDGHRRAESRAQRARRDARSGGCSKASSRSKARSAASTASGSRRRRILASSCRREEIALMKRVKAAFDPNGILNPGKIFPDG